MAEESEVRGLIATQPTLKWFVIIGLVIVIAGIFLLWFNFPLIGLILTWVGIVIIALSLISLLFLWLSIRILPQPK